MHPLRVRREIDGFVADRLLEALWREALWLVHDGVATTEEIDDAIRYGPACAGRRWARSSPTGSPAARAACGTSWRSSGRRLQWPWTQLTDVPELTDELLDAIVAQSDEQAEGLSVRELERLRDDCLVAILQALRVASDDAAGARCCASTRSALLDAAADGLAGGRRVGAAAPARRAGAAPDWIDYNGHMTESRYLQVFANATDAFLRHVGVDAAYLAGGRSYYTVETHIRHLAEAHAGDRLDVETQVLGADEKRLHLFHTVRHGGDGRRGRDGRAHAAPRRHRKRPRLPDGASRSPAGSPNARARPTRPFRRPTGPAATSGSRAAER